MLNHKVQLQLLVPSGGLPWIIHLVVAELHMLSDSSQLATPLALCDA